MVMYAKIRRMYFRENLPISEIARRTSLSRNTVKKWLHAPDGVDIHYRRKAADTILKPFEPWLLQALKADAHRPKRDRRTAKHLFEELKRQGFTGHYSRVTEFVRDWREQGASVAAKAAFVPLKFQLGEAFQFDWSEESLVIGGVLRKVMVAHTKLCASRAFMLSAYPGQSHEMLFDAHNRAFAALGGVARRGIYDNMKTAVDRVSRGNGRIVNTRFHAMVAHYVYEADFCNVASGWEKGVVEKNVQDARRRIWIDAKQHKFSSFDELNLWLEARCRALWAELIHPDYDSITLADALEQEQPYLMAMPTPFDGYVETMGRVSSTCLVSMDKNRYSVPCHLANRMVSIHLYADRVAIYDDTAMVASHRRLTDRDQTSYDWLHYVPLIERKPGALRNGAPFMDMPAPLAKLQAALQRRERQEGNRLMAKVLAAVPTHGLEAVLVAAELVLESGIHSAEHVLNVLARLNQQAMPAQVETNLTLVEEPVADTARYDSLTAMEADHV
jgi:transposase